MTSSIRKNFIWNVIGSTLNATTSLFFLIIVTRINGINDAGIFTFAFSTACLLQVIAVYFGRAYQVTETNKNISDSDYIYSRYFSCFIMLFVSIMFVFLKGYTIYKIIIMLLLTIYKMLDAFAEIIYAIIQKNNDLYKVGISLFLKGLIGTIIFLVTDLLTKNLILSIVLLTISNILILLFYDVRNLKKYDYVKTEFAFSKIKLIFKYGFFTFLFTFLTQYVINASKYAIDSSMADKFQTIFGIILMPGTLIMLGGQLLVHPFLVMFSNNLKENKIKEFSKLVVKITFGVLIFGLLADIVAYLIGIPFLELVYNIKLDKYLIPLIIIISGATLYGMSFIISNALIAMRKTLSQSIIFIVASLFTLILSNKLVDLFGVMGASISYFSTMLLILIMYIIVFAIEIKKLKKYDINHEKNIHTFVVLAYKTSEYLEECIKSVLNQKYKSNVLIATSTPNPYITKLAKKYKLDIIVNDNPKGIGGDFDFAISCAKTKLVTIAHQDDIYDYLYSYEIVKKYEENKNSIILFSDYYEIKNNDKEYKNINLKIKRILLFPLRFKFLNNKKFWKRRSLSLGCPICCPAVTFVKEKINLPLFDYNFKCNIDWHAWETLSKKKGNFSFIYKHLMGHRVHEASTTSKIINDNKRTEEDLVMFKRFWPSFIAKFINKFYVKSEKNNNIKDN